MFYYSIAVLVLFAYSLTRTLLKDEKIDVLEASFWVLIDSMIFAGIGFGIVYGISWLLS